MIIEIRPITKENESALNLPNEPFNNEGRVIPTFDGKNWSYSIEEFAEEDYTVELFPDENYKFEDMGEDFHGFAAYVDGECAGFVIIREEWNKWLYVDNLLVLKKHRRNGIASQLLDAGIKLVEDMGKRGLWLVCQDNNLQAMRFYLSNGFTIEGMNMPVYEGTKQENKSDLYLYKRV